MCQTCKVFRAATLSWRRITELLGCDKVPVSFTDPTAQPHVTPTPYPTPPHHHHPSLWTIKKKCVYILHIPALPGLHINLSQDLPCKKGREKKRVELQVFKNPPEKLGGGQYERKWQAGQQKFSVEVIKHGLTEWRGFVCMRCFFSGIILALTWVRCVSMLILGSQIYLAEGPDQIIPHKQYCLWHLQSSDLRRRGCHFCRLNPSNVSGGHCRFVLTEMSSVAPVFGHYCVCPSDMSLIEVLKWSSKWFIGLTYFSFTFTIILKDSVTGCTITSPLLLSLTVNCSYVVKLQAQVTPALAVLVQET